MHIACTGIGKRIMSGKLNKDGNSFVGTPVDVTNEVIHAVIEKFGTKQSHVITANGEPKYEITIVELNKPLELKG